MTEKRIKSAAFPSAYKWLKNSYFLNTMAFKRFSIAWKRIWLKKKQFIMRLIYRDYNMLLVLYKNEWFHFVNCSTEFLNNTYEKVEDFTVKQRELVRLAACDKLRPDEKKCLCYVRWFAGKKLGRKEKMRLIAVLHRRKFFESEKLYSKASTNFLKKGNFTSEFNVTEDLLKIIRKKINAFRLCRLFEYRFSNAPRNKEVREDDFYILSCKTKGNFPMLDQLLTTEKKILST